MTDLKNSKPKVFYCGEAWHTESSGTGRNKSTRTVTTHTARDDLPIRNYKDISDDIMNIFEV